MLRQTPSDHRRSDERSLVGALEQGDALAFAEAYNRTIAGAHACARRLLSGSQEVEALLTQVYEELWTQGPSEGEGLEGWVRRRCFGIATAHLHEQQRAVASPSTAALLPDLPAPQVRYLDAGERALADLPERERLALLRAHDAGIPSSQQRAWAIVDETGAGSPSQALTSALSKLAGPEPGGGSAPEGTCDDEPRLADWVLGLLDVDDAAEVTQVVEARPECAAAVRTLRRGRRRLEGLPPTPDMGQRILAAVLSQGGGAAGPTTATPDQPATGRPPRPTTGPETQAPTGLAPQPTTGRGPATPPPATGDAAASALDTPPDAPPGARAEAPGARGGDREEPVRTGRGGDRLSDLLAGAQQPELRQDDTEDLGDVSVRPPTMGDRDRGERDRGERDRGERDDAAGDARAAAALGPDAEEARWADRHEDREHGAEEARHEEHGREQHGRHGAGRRGAHAYEDERKRGEEADEHHEPDFFDEHQDDTRGNRRLVRTLLGLLLLVLGAAIGLYVGQLIVANL